MERRISVLCIGDTMHKTEIRRSIELSSRFFPSDSG